MKNVSYFWKNAFNKQLIGATDVEIAVFNDTNVERIEFLYDNIIQDNNFTCGCKELFAFSGSFSTDEPVIRVYFSQPINHYTNPIIKGTYSHIGVGGKLLVELLDENGDLTRSFKLNEDLERSEDTSTNEHAIASMRISTPDYAGGIGNVAYLDIDYFTFGNSPLIYTQKDYERINYEAHFSPTNNDLPYQKIEATMFGLNLPITDKSVAIIYAVHKGLNERVKLGCGYYYAKEVKQERQSNQTIITFVDLLQTLTQRFIWVNVDTMATSPIGRQGKINYPTNKLTNQPLKLADILHYIKDSANYFPDMQKICVPNKVYTGSNGFDFENINVPLNCTVAETLQMIAQANGLMLFMGSDQNMFILNRLPTSDTTYEPINKINLLSKCSIEKRELPNRVVANYYLTLLKDEDNVLATAYLDDYAEGDHFAINIEAENPFALAENFFVENYCEATFSNFYYSSYRAYFYCTLIRKTSQEETPSVVILGNDLENKAITSQVKIVNAYKTSDWKLDCKLRYADSAIETRVITHLYNLAKNATDDFKINVRFDPRFEIGDEISFEEGGETFKGVLTDINMTYNGGFTADLSGIVWNRDLVKPTVKINSLVAGENGSFDIEIYNPNDTDVIAIIKNENDVELTYFSLQSYKTTHLTESNTTQTIRDEILTKFAFGNYVNTDKRIYVYFRIGNRYSPQANIIDSTFLPPVISRSGAILTIYNPNWFATYYTFFYGITSFQKYLISARASITYNLQTSSATSSIYSNYLASNLYVNFYTLFKQRIHSTYINSSLIVVLPKNNI